jgi:Mitochondrial carrier protein
MKSLIELRGVGSLFQSADITFLASLVFGSLGFGATELFRRSFTLAFFPEEGGGQTNVEIVLLAAAALACVVTSAAATPFEVLRVKSMGLVEQKGWTAVLDAFLEEKNGSRTIGAKFNPKDLLPLWSGFFPTVSRELPFAVTKFLVFDVLTRELTGVANAQLDEGAIPVQVGVGTLGLAISAISGAIAGVAGAVISHPADLILTLTSTSTGDENVDWKEVVKELVSREGGIANLFIGLPARSVFFFLVIGLQFFLYDYVKNVFEVGSDDLSLVLDVFYAVRQGFLDMSTTPD